MQGIWAQGVQPLRNCQKNIIELEDMDNGICKFKQWCKDA